MPRRPGCPARPGRTRPAGSRSPAPRGDTPALVARQDRGPQRGNAPNRPGAVRKKLLSSKNPWRKAPTRAERRTKTPYSRGCPPNCKHSIARAGAIQRVTGLVFHLIPHTHWDREWYRPRADFLARLIPMLDSALATLAADPRLTFLLDGQTVLLRDYLAARPS